MHAAQSAPPIQKTTSREPTTDSRARTALLDVRALFDRHGTCSIALLPRKPEGWPTTARISTGSEVRDIEQLQEGWYEEVKPADIETVLLNGAVWRELTERREWLLSGREVFVLAAHPELRGFLSCARLETGRRHVVLFRSSRAREIETALNEAGSVAFTVAADGVPPGWTALRDVVPNRAVPRNDDADILNILRPLPEIDIQLEGGVPVDRSSWLFGRPPTIRVYGPNEQLTDVLIDGQHAQPDPSNAFSVPGVTEIGDHEIWCSGVTRRFSIVTRPLRSTVWDAHRFTSRDSRHAFSVCGPLVQGTDESISSEIAPEKDLGPPVFLVAATHPVLIGANPGEIQIVTSPTESWRIPGMASVAFKPVWGLPLSPLLADKRRASIRYLGPGDVDSQSNVCEPAEISQPRKAVERWCSYVLDTSRKGLPLERASPELTALWREHRRRARDLRRRYR